jgi:hypothetical protein
MVSVDVPETITVDGIVGAAGADGVDGADGATGPSGVTMETTDPLITTNGTLGELWLNTTSGELYACTDITTDENIWTNIGDGTGNIVPNDPPGNPTNTTIGDQGTGSSFTYTFTGGTDTDGTVTHYMVDEITGTSGGNVVANPLTVALAEVPVGVPHQFTVGTLPDASDISFRVRSKDNNGSYSSGVTVNFNGTVAVPYFGGRGLFERDGWPLNSIEYVTIATNGNGNSFGNLWTGFQFGPTACSNGTRGVWGGGKAAGLPVDTIEYNIISTTGDSVSFGNLVVGRRDAGACSDGVRGVWGGGGNCETDIQYITMDTTGSAFIFGNWTMCYTSQAACSNGVRGVWGGGRITMEYITIATISDGSIFGNLSLSITSPASCSDGTRGLFAGGHSGGYLSSIDYITIETTSNVNSFGNLTLSRATSSSCSDGTRGLFGGGYNNSASYLNSIDYVTIATTGNANDFGDLIVSQVCYGSCSGD